eukprot:TRINITY_DN13817_c0_g2_i1.p1 TRINITY_DN13817_c0_g2~~TRINITY_DN13817_c0_g2_i1.p1  ORF type:complete len:188 (-),score=10.50 TRINITY_DN13817_c0_g2_i1:76-639(-)
MVDVDEERLRGMVAEADMPWPDKLAARPLLTGSDLYNFSHHQTDSPRGMPLSPRSIGEGMTTLMLVGLPYTLSFGGLRDELLMLGFANSFDFMYYPKDTSNSRGRGYCFINFVSTAEARRFARAFANYSFDLAPWPKRSNAVLARTQGFEANVHGIHEELMRTDRLDNAYFDPRRLELIGVSRSAKK